MFGVCLRYANNRQEAEDMLQEGFIKVFRDLKQYNGMGSLEGWIRRVIVHAAIDYLRSQRNWTEMHKIDPAVLQLPADERSDDGDLETGKMLIALMQKLPPGFRAVLNMYVMEGFTHQEIAARLGISEGTSKSQLSRARQLMKKLFEQKLAT
jgi:RNA polymerase sigma-70 factor (ECF subfamily)